MVPVQNNAQYWARRMKIMEDALKDQSYSYVENLEEQFAAAQREIERQISVWYQRFAVNNEISFAAAKRLLTKDELEEFRWTVEDYIKHGEENALDGRWMRELENASARVHISRLESLKLQIQQQAELLYANQLDYVDAAARQIYEGSYYHTAFEFQKGLGVGWSLHAINEDTISKVLSRPWTADNLTFRDRCWTNKQNLVNSVNTHLTQMIIRGEAPDRAIAAISKQFGVAKDKAGRLVMTESAYFASAAQKDCFNELDVELYKVVAALDQGTCDLCGELDGEVFKMSEFQVGLTAPPFHPWCRCCTCPYYEDMEGLGERYARDVITGESFKVPGSMTYGQWKAKQDELYGGGTVDLKRKKQYNYSKDKAQFQQYKSVLGELAPKSLEDFRRIKYQNSEDWAKLKYQYRSVNQYSVDGDVRIRDVLELDGAAWNTKQTGFNYEAYSGKNRKKIRKLATQGNAAVMKLDGNLYFAHSSISTTDDIGYDAYTGRYPLVLRQDNRRFTVLDLGDGIPRSDDTEAKFLEYVAGIKAPSDVFEVTILSEKHICKSCGYVVKQFKAAFPNSKVNVISGKCGYNGSENGLKTWKHRG